MSSRIAIPLEAQASALVSFLAQSKHSLSLESALEICGSMRTAKEPAARFLKAALAGRNIEVKHTSCLKAVALMDGFDGHVSRPKLEWVVAQYTFDAPAITPKVKRHRRSTDATADICTRLVEDLAGAKESPYAYVSYNADYLEFVFIGEPQPGARYILACKNRDGSTATIGDSDVVSAVERVRRVVEGQFRGWLDGATKISLEDGARLCLLKDGEPIADGQESDVLAACERDDEFVLEADSLLRLPAVMRRYQVFRRPAGQDEAAPADDTLVERMWRRLEAFYRFNDEDFSWFLSRRREEEEEGRFDKDGIDTERLTAVLTARNISDEQAASMADMSPAEWNAMMETEEAPRETVLKLSEWLQLSSANELYFDSRNPVWMPVKDGEEIALWMRNFDHLHLSVSGIAESAPLAQRCLEKLTLLHRRVADRASLQVVLSEAEAAGLHLCVTIGKRFVSDLPVFRERLAMVGHLSFWNRKEIESFGPPNTRVNDLDGQPWSAIDDEYLAKFNSVDMTLDDLIALQEEVARGRRDGQEPGWETSTFASIRVFKGKPDSAHRAHTAMTRMTAMGRLIEDGALAIWMEKSNEPDVALVPKNVLHAAARCPLIRVGDEPGFDLATFRRFALELVAPK
ncbi:hypothetical protein [Burkholderia vietnamiensis]|uniref:hypothetical protein n=1 Tax=Burkholderia vietnamiensis TaxID=60552 RepID=UPI001CF25FBE|nr:hypothetical protein [Burkholderia vietnamiensis]MCA8287314.1 hypothetical protein [Burkholderia vietnamiensis]